MRIIRYKYGDGEPGYGWVFEDRVGPIDGSPFSDFQRNEAVINLTDVELLVPVVPQKIICVGRNYAAHAEEHGAEVPEAPLLFLKPPSALIALHDEIVLPPQSNQIEHEAELAVIIAKRGRWISTEDALDFILGYTIANDVTARDLQQRDGQWTRGKGFDTFCPLGPWIKTDFDPTDKMLTCHVNGQMRQMASTHEMVFTVPQLIAFASSIMTLLPGDTLLTGTPSGVGPLKPGDEVEIAIEDLGSLVNPVVAQSSR